MNDSLPVPTAPASGDAGDAGYSPADDDQRSIRRERRKMLVLGLLILTLVAGVWFDTYHRARELDVRSARRFADLEAQSKATRALGEQAQEAVREAQAKITLLETRLSEFQDQQTTLETLYHDLTPGRDGLVLSETEQMLFLASQQLQLGGNVQNALSALQAADARLQRLNRPQFASLRRALAKDMDRLKSLSFVDLTNISLRLDQIIGEVDKLPLALEERLPDTSSQPAETTPTNRAISILREFVADIKSLIRIDDLQPPAPPLLPPSQRYFARETLRLRLLTARQALLSRDDANFHADLSAVEDALKRYFDQRSKTTQAALSTVKQMQGLSLTIELPDLATSLNAIRALRLERDGAAERS